MAGSWTKHGGVHNASLCSSALVGVTSNPFRGFAFLTEQIDPFCHEQDKEQIALIDLIYEAVLDSDLWPTALLKLADAVGVAQIAMPSFDWRENIFTTVAPRFDPELLASYKEYWAFQEPLVPRATLRPIGEIYALDTLMPRDEFAATPVFNEWWQQAGCCLAAMGANLGINILDSVEASDDSIAPK